ncbi:hypothetical protein [Ferrimonas pelagia]|uniref:Outer membrane protein assembly factor BamE n=1 Tax=Ferrimonas pelagia TaxID=1177826 RepID=A0ABP9FBU8_9GAMM
MSIRVCSLMALFTLLTGCAQYSNNRGVEVGWQSEWDAQLVKGQTQRSEVLAKLGPPSQMVALGDKSALYYLFEKAKGEALILVFYNKLDVNTQYDRAVFFFDENDTLTDYSTVIYADDPS